MVKPDWNNFKAKFSDNLQSNFEWMCYLLFCNEHGKKTGIFRFKNQSAIETNPLEFDGKVIGWQAKFYETALSHHKAEMLAMLENAKRDYPEISKICFYTNSEWGQYKGKEPSGKTEIDSKAKELSIELEWRCRSYFESHFVVDDNKRVVSHFFRQSDGIIEFLESLASHTDNILGEIETEIDFNDQQVVIDRSEILSKVETTKKQVVVLSGEGGIGKTALIKSLYKKKHPDSAFYVHKAAEFSVHKIDEFLSGISLNDFIYSHQGTCTKIVVIDSAENLLGLNNIDPFKEYVSALLEDGWKIWLTTRNNYLGDLAFQFLENYKITYQFVNLTCLTHEELSDLARKYNFRLPDDQRLIELIKIPFYLREYLNHHQKSKCLDYIEFKNSLWPRVITKGSPQREQFFLKLVVTRANSGHFFVQIIPGTDNQQIVTSLSNDGIISYESPYGYFITHDIYEEWALEKHLESMFLVSNCATTFLDEIKQSLPVRRAFRKWLSGQLGDQNLDVISFIYDALSSDEIPKLWSDEILISILLSNYSNFFFDSNRQNLLNNDCSLLKQISLLIRLGCKEVDNSCFKLIGLTTPNILSMEYLFTKPKGNGWKSLIKFVFENYSSIGNDKFQFILPLIYDWNSSNKSGETTKYSSLLALKYYEWQITNDIYISESNTSNNLILTILYGVQEISTELSNIIDQVKENRWNNHNDPYYLLSKYILSKLECVGVATKLPEKAIDLAKLFWIYKPTEDDEYHDYSSDRVYHSFGMTHNFPDYYPSSAYQTPIYCLLRTNLNLALDFVIEFINDATEKYVSSTLDQSGVENAVVILDKETTTIQYISERLWHAYRGTHVNPDILESILMSLERFLLDIGKYSSSENLETILHYVLSRTNSAALSSLVTSIVLAFPEKTFKVAKILFRTKQFFVYDTMRKVRDQTHKSQLTTLKKSFGINRMNQLHENERINACDEKHRKLSLEDLILQYQFFRSGETSEEEAIDRLDEIWNILDAYYDKLPAKEDETDADKTWRLFLARVDKRKMSPVAEATKDGIMIELNPEIDSELKEYSEEALKESSELFKHTQLLLWSEDRLYFRNEYEKYDTYESNPILALKEAKEIWSDIVESNDSVSIFDRSLPSVVCAVLLRDFPEKMDKKDLEFCKEVIFYYGSLFLENEYFYQASDGVLPALSVLPILTEFFPEEEGIIKYLMILALMHESPIDIGVTKFNSVVINAIQPLWKKDFDFALSIYIGYIILAQKKNNMLYEYKRNAMKYGRFDFDHHDFMEKFKESNSAIFEKIVNESIISENIKNIENVDINILSTAFQITPLKSECTIEIPYTKEIIATVSEKILSDDREDKIDYSTRHSFLEKYTRYVLHLELHEIKDYLAPFVNNFVIGEGIVELIKEFISSEDYANRPDHFWTVWKLFRDKIVDASVNGKGRHYANKVIESYMFAHNYWKEDAKEWHTFSQERKGFFSDLTKKLGGDASYLYSLSKLLCSLGNTYIDDGIFWLSSAIKSNEINLTGNNRDNTIFYLEKSVRIYLFTNREKVRRTAQVKSAVIVILDFLIDNGSIIGYLLREDVA